MNRRIVLLAFLALSLAACGPNKSTPAALAGQHLTIVTRDGATHDFSIEMATTQSEIENGLMFRKHLDPDAGMLFYFGRPERETAFWMKDTLIPLDMLFIRADGAIKFIHANAKPGDETEVLSNGPVAGVLEINGGRAAALGIKVGDRVRSGLFGGGG
jgi:uncharacterized membrane protein (UPF0127 family)